MQENFSERVPAPYEVLNEERLGAHEEVARLLRARNAGEILSKVQAKSIRRFEQGNFAPAPLSLPSPVVDNHTHLNFRDRLGAISVSQAMDAAAQVGVSRAVQVGFDLESSEFTVQAVEADSRLLGAVALHPNDSATAKAEGSFDRQFARIVELSEHPRIRAIGETGLDYFRTEPALQAGQREAFEAHIALAKERDLPVMIHDRDAHQDVVATLKRVGAPSKVIFHCFSGDAELAEICNEHGWYMSFAGTLTFGSAVGVREAATLADPALILVETDSPFLTPEPYRGRPNASYQLPRTVHELAQLREVDLEALCALIAKNSEQVYGPW